MSRHVTARTHRRRKEMAQVAQPQQQTPQKHHKGRQPVSVGTAVGNALLRFVQGCVRGMALHKVAATLSRSRAASLRAMVGKCVFYNGVLFLGSMLLYDNMILPLTRFIFGGSAASSGVVAERIIGAIYQIFWLWPLYLVTFAVSSSLHSRITNEAVRVRHTSIAAQATAAAASSSSSSSSTTAAAAPMGSVSLAGSLSDMSYKTLLYSVFAAETMLIDLLVPFFGRILSFAFTALLYSFVCFECVFPLPHTRISATYRACLQCKMVTAEAVEAN